MLDIVAVTKPVLNEGLELCHIVMIKLDFKKVCNVKSI